MTKKAKKQSKRAKQGRLPGTEDHRLEELHSLADALLDAKDEAKNASDGKKAAEAALVTEMKKQGRTVYVCDGLEIKVKTKDDSVSVKKLDRKADEEAE